MNIKYKELRVSLCIKYKSLQHLICSTFLFLCSWMVQKNTLLFYKYVEVQRGHRQGNQ